MSAVIAAARANLVLSITNGLVAIASSAVVVRSLGPEGYADYATLLGILSWALLIFEAGGNSGLMRFFPEAAASRSRGTLLKRVIYLRLAVSAAAALTLVLAGPTWAARNGLSQANWSLGVFAVLTVGLGAGLLGLPAQFALLSGFRHRATLLAGQALVLLRALAVAVVAWIVPSLLALAFVIAAVAILEAMVYHRLLWPQMADEASPLSSGVLSKLLRHGLVTVFDKVSSQIGNGPFLLVVLAASVSRPQLAILAVASDLGLKALSLAGMPIGAMVLPYLNSARVTGDIVRATGQVAVVSTTLFSTALGGYLVLVGPAIPLLFGNLYQDAIVMAQVIGVALFVDGWGRQTYSASLITYGSYRAISLLNAFLALGAIALLALTWKGELMTIVVAQAGLRIIGTIALVVLATRGGLCNIRQLPVRWMGVVAVALVMANFVSRVFALNNHLAELMVVTTSFCGVLLVALRDGRCLDPEVQRLIVRVSGRHAKIVKFFVR